MIAIGRRADLAVLDDDIIDPAFADETTRSLADVHVAMTLAAGRIVHDDRSGL